jgi:minimal PKS acyl carrier protein
VRTHRIGMAELAGILRECGGEDTGTALVPELLDTPFHELGHDSLTVLQAMNKVGRTYGVRLPEELMLDADTPRLLLQIIDQYSAHHHT